jgi:hypothetical protein
MLVGRAHPVALVLSWQCNWPPTVYGMDDTAAPLPERDPRAAVDAMLSPSTETPIELGPFDVLREPTVVCGLST